MELEEMQAAWIDMSGELEKQKQITNELVMKMTQERYRNHWNKLANPDKLFTVIGFILVIVLIFNFGKLDTLALQICGILSILILIILPIFSIKTMRDLQYINIGQNTYKETMEVFAKRKQRFVNFQKLNMWVSFVFMLVSIPITMKLLKGENILETLNKRFLIVLPICIFLFYFLARYLTKCTKSVLKKSETILEDLNE